MASSGRKALLKKLSGAKASGVGNNARDGKYRWVVKKIGFVDGFKGERFQVELVVLNSAKIRVISPANPKGNPPKMEETYPDIEPDAVGKGIDWMQVDLNNPKSPGPSNIRKLIEVLFNQVEEDDEYLGTLAEVADLDEEGEPLKVPLNLCKGMLIDGETLRIITKENKKEIIVIKWSHVATTNEEQAQYAKWVDDVATAQQAQLPAGTAQATA